jgi:TRAP-type mannitol/chloroaromatic compound transport system substrate-binding protein
MRDALLSQLPGGELVRALEDETLDFVEDHAEAEDDG